MTDDGLTAGRAALAGHEWETGYALLSAEDLLERLTTQDLEGVGDAAFWTGRPRDCVRFRERAPLPPTARSTSSVPPRAWH